LLRRQDKKKTERGRIDMIRNNRIAYLIANNSILQFTSRNSVTSLFSLATTDIDLARLRHNAYPSALVSAFQMMNWPIKFLIWSSMSTLPLSIGTLQRNAAQLTHKRRYFTMYLMFNNTIAADQCWYNIRYAIVMSRLFRKSFNCRYNPRMDYAFCLITLKSSEKWRSRLFGATCNFNDQILPYGILCLASINANVFYLMSFKFLRKLAKTMGFSFKEQNRYRFKRKHTYYVNASKLIDIYYHTFSDKYDLTLYGYNYVPYWLVSNDMFAMFTVICVFVCLIAMVLTLDNLENKLYFLLSLQILCYPV
jgi:hypothetical protein